MVANMNEEKERAASPSSKKVCPRAARENARKSNITMKPAHSGLRFHFDRKKLETHEFTFNSVSKTEKVTRCRHVEKSSEKQNSAEKSNTTDSKKIEVLMDTLKISRSEECSNREKSPLRKEMPKSPVVERLMSKKACTRCSRCSKTPKEEKPETKPLEVAKNQDKTPKIPKKENLSAKTVKHTPKTPNSPKPLESKKQCSKLAKILVEPSEKALKPKSILIHNEKPASNDSAKNETSKNCETPQSPKPITAKKQCSKLAKLLGEPQEKNLNAKPNIGNSEKSHSRDNEKTAASKICEKFEINIEKVSSEKSFCVTEKKVEFSWPGTGNPENNTLRSETPNSENVGKSENLNGSEHPSESDTKACLLNGSRHDEHLCDPHLGLESPGGTKESMKGTSKIPRKTIGMKLDGGLNKDAMPQLIEL